MEIFQFMLSITLERLPSSLLVFIPAAINLSIILYIVFVMPRTRLAKVFLLFNIGLLCWQITDLFGRLSADAVTANFWDRLLCMGWMLVGPLSLHFALLYSNKKELLRSYLVVGTLYVPTIVLAILYNLWVDDRFYTFHAFWGYVNPHNHSIFFLVITNWISILVLIALTLMVINTYRSKANPTVYYQSLFITVGFAIPVFQGIITQVILPNTIGIAIPVTSTFMIFLSIATVVALNRYHLFRLADSVDAEDLLDLLPEIVFTTGPSGNLFYANAYTQRLFNLSNHYIENVDVGFMFNGNDYLYKAFNDSVMAPVAQGQTIVNVPCQLVNKDGKEVHTIVSAEQLSQTNRIPGMVVIARDISEQKKSEIALEEQRQVLKKTNAELEKFLYSTSHDLRAPLTTIMGLIEIARKERDNANMGQYLGMMNDTVNKLDDYIQEVIAFSKNHSLPLEMEKVLLKDELDLVLQRLAIKMGDIPVNIEHAYPSGTAINTDKLRLREVLFQILLNAIMYRNRATKEAYVRISYKESNSHHEIQISDNGEGMGKEVLGRAFEMFYRGSEKATGSGLGLYIAQSIVHKLGGIIKLDSEPGKGTIVTVAIP